MNEQTLVKRIGDEIRAKNRQVGCLGISVPPSSNNTKTDLGVGIPPSFVGEGGAADAASSEAGTEAHVGGS